MKKITMSILTAAIAFAPTVAQAQNAQTNVQTSNNSATAIGNGNFIRQNTDQISVQNQLNLDAYGIPATPNAQTSVQVNANEAAAIGNYNVIDQNGVQTSVQGQVDINQYLPQNFQY